MLKLRCELLLADSNLHKTQVHPGGSSFSPSTWKSTEEKQETHSISHTFIFFIFQTMFFLKGQLANYSEIKFNSTKTTQMISED